MYKYNFILFYTRIMATLKLPLKGAKAFHFSKLNSRNQRNFAFCDCKVRHFFLFPQTFLTLFMILQASFCPMRPKGQ